MSKKIWYPRNSPYPQNNMMNYAHPSPNNQIENQEPKVEATGKGEQSLSEELKNKCAISNGTMEQGTTSTYYYNSNVAPVKKNGEISQNLPDNYYPNPQFQESGYTRPTFPPAEAETYASSHWDGNSHKRYEQRDMQAFVYAVPPNYHGEPVPNYPPIAHTLNYQEMFKAYTPAQYDFPPTSNNGSFMKVYYWHSNMPNVYRPGGPPIPLKNVDIYAQMSVASDFSDLPLGNKETLRFFYNLGVEYFRLGSFILPTAPPVAIDHSNNSDPGKQEKYFKKRGYCRKSQSPQKNYRTL